MAIQSLSAVTLATRDMARAVEFYQKLGYIITGVVPDAKRLYDVNDIQVLGRIESKCIDHGAAVTPQNIIHHEIPVYQKVQGVPRLP